MAHLPRAGDTLAERAAGCTGAVLAVPALGRERALVLHPADAAPGSGTSWLFGSALSEWVIFSSPL